MKRPPFSDKSAAEKFAGERGGRVVRFAEVPRDYVLGPGETASSQAEAPSANADGTEHSHSSAHTHAGEPQRSQ